MSSVISDTFTLAILLHLITFNETEKSIINFRILSFISENLSCFLVSHLFFEQHDAAAGLDGADLSVFVHGDHQ